MLIDKDLKDWERDQLEDMLDDIGVVLCARKVARRHGLDRLDDCELDNMILNIMDEIERRNTEDEAAALAEYWKEAFV
jgi:hypothetical protein